MHTFMSYIFTNYVKMLKYSPFFFFILVRKQYNIQFVKFLYNN